MTKDKKNQKKDKGDDGRQPLTAITSVRSDMGSSWTPEIVLYLKTLQNSARVFKLLHARQAAHLAKKGKIMKVINVVFTSISGTTVLANIEFDETWILIAVGLLMYLTAIMIGISEFMDYSSEAENHKTAETDFEELTNLIERQLVLEPKYRQNAREFMIWADRDFNIKKTKNPLITDRTKKQIHKKFGDKVDMDRMDFNQINDLDVEKGENTSSEIIESTKEETTTLEENPTRARKSTKEAKKSNAKEIDEIDPDWDTTMRMRFELDRFQQ